MNCNHNVVHITTRREQVPTYCSGVSLRQYRSKIFLSQHKGERGGVNNVLYTYNGWQVKTPLDWNLSQRNVWADSQERPTLCWSECNPMMI